MADLVADVEDIAAKVSKGFEAMEGWFGTVRPPIEAFVKKVTGSKVGQALLALGEAELPPEADELIAALVSGFGKLAAAVPAAPAAPAPEAPGPTS